MMRYTIGARLSVALLAGTVLLPAAALAEPAIERSVGIAPGLYEIVFNPQSDQVIIAAAGRRGENTAQILALDPETLEIQTTIDVSDAPGYGLGINTATQMLYTTNTRSGSVSVIDLATGAVVATIAEGEGAHLREAIVDEATNTVYVSNVGGRDAPGAIWVIDGAANQVTRVIDGLEAQITGLALDAAANRLYATGLDTDEVLAIDLASGTVAQRYPSGGVRPTNLVLDPESGRLFVTNQESGTLTVLDAGSGDLLQTIPTGEGALGVSRNPATGLVYVANRGAGTVTVIDGETYAVVADLETGTHPNTVAIDPETGIAYVSNKAQSGGRDAPPVVDPNGDTVSIITP